MGSLPAVLIGALLTGALISVALLAYVAQENDFRIVRRASGADDAAILDSYNSTERYRIHNLFAKRYPGAEFVVAAVAEENVGNQLLLFASFAASGPVCPADSVTGRLVREVLPRPAGRIVDASFRWETDDPRGGRHSVYGGEASDRFLVVLDGRNITAVGADLLTPPLSQRCRDAH